MGWTFNVQREVAFQYQGPTQVHADGNNVAWKCQACDHPILFVYQNGRIGSGPRSPTECPGCQTRYYLEPPYFRPEPDQPTPPAPLMTIVQVGGSLP